LDEDADCSLCIAIHGILQNPSMRRLRIRKLGGLYETEPVEHEVDRRPIQDTITVELLNGRARLRSWPVPCFSREHPFMLFSERTGAVEPALAIRDAGCWVAFPRTYELIGGLVREQGCELWQDFHVQLLSLQLDQHLRLRHEGEAGEIPIPIHRVDGGVVSIVRDAQPWPGVTCEGFEVFSAAPDIVVPGATEDGVARVLTIDSLDQAGPTRSVAVGAGVHPDQTPCRFSLADQRALGRSAFGRYVLRLRGRLGEDQVFRVCIVPGLRVHLRVEDLVPSERDDAPIELQICVASGVEIEAVQPATLVRSRAVSTEMREFTMRTPRSELGATVNVRCESAGDSAVRLMVDIPLVRWAVTGLSGGNAPRFTQEPLSLSLSDLEEATDPRLLIRCDLGEEARVLAETGDDHQRAIPLRSGAGSCRLAEFLDTWRSRGRDSCLRLQIDGSEFTRSVDVIRIRNQWAVEGVDVVEEVNGEQRSLLVTWHDEGRASDRRLRIWDLARPWRPPVEQAIADGESAVIVERPDSELPRSVYRLQFVIQDPWGGEPCPAVPPAASAANIVEHELGGVARPFFRSEFESWIHDVARAQLRGLSIATLLARSRGCPSPDRTDYEVLASCLLFWLPDGEFECKINADVWRQVCGQADGATAPGRLLHGLATAYQRGQTSELAERIRRLVLGLDLLQLNLAAPEADGFDDQLRDRLWEVWEPLGLILELADFERIDHARFARRCLRAFGSEPLAAMLGLNDPDERLGCDNECETCLLCHLGVRVCSAPSRIRRPNGVYGRGTGKNLLSFLTKSAEEIRALRDDPALMLVPNGRLHADEYVRLILTWLIDSNVREKWLKALRSYGQRDNTPPCEDAAQMLSQARNKAPATAGLCDAVMERNAELLVENVPLLSGCVALLQRLVARAVASVARPDELRHLAIRAYRAAPDLYCRDLCLFELSIALLLIENEARHGA
jgi:hypothetical protein